MTLYPVNLSESQIKLVRKLISEKHLEVKFHPLPEEKDGKLAKELCELDKPFHFWSQIL